jgi:uncharacterized protein (DUF885 family)
VAEEPSARLATLAARYWEATLAFSPLLATYLGDRRFDDRLDDRSDAAIAGHRSWLAGLAAEIDAEPADALAGEDRITRSALLAQVRRDGVELDANLDAWAVDPLEGPQVRALDLAAIQVVTTPDQARAMVARWNALGAWFDARADRLRRGVGEGRVAVRTPVEKVLEQLGATLAQADDELPLLAPLAEDHPDWPAADRAAFRDGLRGAVGDVVRPALERFRSVIGETILPVARPDERPGLVHVPGGREAYDALVELHTSLPLAADEIHAIGLEEVARIDDELGTLGGRVLGTADLAETRRRLRSDPAMHFASRDEVFGCAEASLVRAQAAVPAWFGIQPVTPCVVVRMQAHEERYSTIAYYREPATDGSRPGQYYINTSEPETRPRYEAEALAFHEAVPGHHLQLAIGQELTGLPAFRRHSGPTAYVEGWGLYTERLSDEMGLYTADLDRIGVLSFDAWRACRLVVDTGMHALGWTRQQAVDFMLDHTVLAANNVLNEVDRYITWPGQALAYKIGQREILKLRGAAQRELGPQFDIRGFHDAVLGHGAVGLDTLGEIVGSWVRDQGA